MARTFHVEDQSRFAALSGDNNPLHVDPIAARRYLFGQPVVHGVHAVLWALDRWLSESAGPVHLKRLKASFHRPIFLDEPVESSSTSRTDDQVDIELHAGGVLPTTIEVQWDDSPAPPNTSPAGGLPQLRPPRALSFAEIAAASGRMDLQIDPQATAQLFPHLAHRVSPLQVATMLATSRLVGVECPGLHSVFAELELKGSDGEPDPVLRYEVSKFDPRLRMVLMVVSAPGMSGTVRAFVRPGPRAQAGYTELQAQVRCGEFRDQRALVVGGSRGLGEVVAKLLCAGGAQVWITYHQGEADAKRLVSEIPSGRGIAGCSRFDVLAVSPDSLYPIQTSLAPTHLYYFATPPITPSAKRHVLPDLLQKYMDVYGTGFINTVQGLRDSGLEQVFYPSTVFVDQLPPGMGEYATAKAAGETICAFLGNNTELRFYVPRLPRMATDQTVSLLPSSVPEPAPILLQHLRAFRDEFRDEPSG